MAASDLIKDGSRDPNTTYTLDMFIAMKPKDDITYYNFSILEVIDGVQHLDRNLLEDYIEDLNQLSVDVVLSQDELTKYKYAPDLLAFDIYGSTQLDFMIMLLNDMIDPKEFTKTDLRLPLTSVITDFFSSIIQGEYNYLMINRESQGLNMRF